MSDFYQDQGAFFVKLFNAAHVPDFVKTAAFETEEGVDSLPDSAFADPAHRQYPIHTAADVYVSAAYLYGKTAGDSSVADKIKKAGSIFGIQDSLDEAIALAKARFESANKVAEGPKSWQFETKTASFSGQGPEHLKSAAKSLISNYQDFPFAERTEIAENLQKLASELGTELPVEIEKFAGDSHINMDLLETQLQARALMLHDRRDVENFLGKIAQMKDLSGLSPSEGLKLAEFLSGFDSNHNLTRFYGSRIEDPHSAVFNTPMAQRNEDIATVKVGHVVHKLVDLKKHQGDLFEGLLGRKIADLRQLADLSESEAALVNQVIC